MKLRITGNSHVACLKHGLETMPLYGEHDIKISGFTYGKDQRKKLHTVDGKDITLDGNRIGRFAEVMGSKTLDRKAIWGICMAPHAEFLYTQENPKVDFFADSLHVMNLIRDMMDAEIQTFAIFTPGPNRNHKEMPQGGSARARHIDLDYRAWLRSTFTDLGLEWIEALPEAHDDSGFIKPEHLIMTKHDHGNATYGAAMMQRILTHIGHG